MRHILTGIVMLILFVMPVVPVHAEAQTLSLEEQVAALAAEMERLSARLSGTAGRETLSAAEIDAVIDAGYGWMLTSQEDNGHFRYEYAPYDDAYLNDDNIVRQTGALYQLGEALRRSVDTQQEQEIATAMVRSIDYFEGLSKEGEYNNETFRCITESERSNRCKLGATALALIAILSLAEYDESYADEYASLIDDYISYVTAMKMEDAGFRYYFHIGQSLQQNRESTFSTGEALLALARYYAYDQESEVKVLIDESFDYIKTELGYDVPLYLWVMAALEEMYAVEPRAEYETYIRDYTDWRIDGFRYRRGTGNNMCAYTEGIALAYELLDKFVPELQLTSYRNELMFWLTKGSTLQLTEADEHRFVYVNGTSQFLSIENTERAIGGFLTSEDTLTQRIDYTQHCLNAYLIGREVAES